MLGKPFGMGISALLAYAYLATPTLVLASQVPAQPQPGFEVASIRRNTSESRDRSARAEPGGGFTAVNMPLRDLLVTVFSVPKARIIGGPDWLDSERYDIVAKGSQVKNVQLSLVALLRERFGLVARRESREFPAYFLVTAKPDGELGPRLTPARVNCSDPRARQAAAEEVDLIKPPGCGIRQRPGRLLAGAVTLNSIVGYFGAGRPVLDKTGLEGTFDVDLEWAATPDSDGVSIFTAVQEQLGLRLENGRTPLDVIIIERVEALRPN